MKATTITRATRSENSRKEDKAFVAYSRALREWDRARDRYLAIQESMEGAVAELLQCQMNGSSGALYLECKERCDLLYRKQHLCSTRMHSAKRRASELFKALILARHAGKSNQPAILPGPVPAMPRHWRN